MLPVRRPTIASGWALSAPTRSRIPGMSWTALPSPRSVSSSRTYASKQSRRRASIASPGIPGEAIEARLRDCFEAYVRELETLLGDGSAVQLMPGIRDLVGALSAHPDAIVGLLTGNIEAGARLKLRPTRLLPHFRVGAYGSDHIDRRRLPPIARERAARLVGRDIDDERVTIIGDTPHDVDCARASGAVAVAVATGQYPADELAACAPDLLFRDFSDVARTVAALTNGPGS